LGISSSDESLVYALADVLMVTMVTHSVVPGTRVGRACVPAAREVAINTATLVVWTPGPTALSVTAAGDMQVIDGHSALMCLCVKETISRFCIV